MRPSRIAILLAAILTLAAGRASAAEPAAWAGQYEAHKFLNDRAVFQLSLEPANGTMKVSFDAAWVDGHGAAPDAEGSGKVSGDTLTFKFEDSFGNTGTGTITRAGADIIIVSLDPTRVKEPRCLAFYGKNMKLKRVRK